MSADGTPDPGPPVANGRFTKGYDARRAWAGITRAEREFRAALESQHIPKASGLLAAVYAQAMVDVPKGKTQMADLYFRVCNLIKKPRDDDQVAALARNLLQSMIAEAQAQQGLAPADPKMIDVGTDE
jgi:hypothetical protein